MLLKENLLFWMEYLFSWHLGLYTLLLVIPGVRGTTDGKIMHLRNQKKRLKFAILCTLIIQTWLWILSWTDNSSMSRCAVRKCRSVYRLIREKITYLWCRSTWNKKKKTLLSYRKLRDVMLMEHTHEMDNRRYWAKQSRQRKNQTEFVQSSYLLQWP